MISLGIPKEIKTQESRVSLIPQAVKEIVDLGNTVYVQSGAGEGSGFSDSDYRRSGAEILGSATELYARAVLIQKVKEPMREEYSLLKSHHILFCFLHLASPEHCDLVAALEKSGATALAYETLKDQGKLAVLIPMSQIAGSLSALYAAFIQTHVKAQSGSIQYAPNFFEKWRQLAAHYPLIPHDLSLGRILIFGAGVAGMAAFQTAKKLKGMPSLVEINPELREQLKNQGIPIFSIDVAAKEALPYFDTWVGCAHKMGERAAKVIDEDTLAFACHRNKKLLIDIAIDQGGNFPDSRSTSYDAPLYLDRFGNRRFCVPNIPSWAGRLASTELSKACLPYTKLLLINPTKAMSEHPAIHSAVNIKNGMIELPAIKTAHQR